MMVLAAVLLTMALVQFKSEVRKARRVGGGLSSEPDARALRRVPSCGRGYRRVRPTGPETWGGLFSAHAIDLLHGCRSPRRARR